MINDMLKSMGIPLLMIGSFTCGHAYGGGDSDVGPVVMFIVGIVVILLGVFIRSLKVDHIK